MFPITCPRVGAGVAAQPGKAAAAASRAVWTSLRVEWGKTPRQSDSRAGLVDSKVPPSEASVSCPPTML